jgi:hypothetical protein
MSRIGAETMEGYGALMSLYSRTLVSTPRTLWCFTTLCPQSMTARYVTQHIFNVLNSVNQLIFVTVKCGVLFEVRTEFLNVI